MNKIFNLSQFISLFPTDDACIEEIKKLRYPHGIFCVLCKKITKHYKLRGRTAYSCMLCRNQVYPLSDTIFEKTTTPLKLWFYAMFLMTYSRADISAKQLQRELGVTYKTAWRMYKRIRMLMAQNNGDLLSTFEISEHKWILFNKFEITVVQKKES